MSTEPQSGETPETPTIESFDGWIDTQPDEIKALVTQHTSGLKSALDNERAERKRYAAELRDATTRAEAGSAAQAALQAITERVELAERRAAFYEDAIRPEVGCSNAKAAYLVATADNLYTRTGEPDWPQIKAEAPELFRDRSSTANAGSGTQTPPRTQGMNEFIRQAAGRL